MTSTPEVPQAGRPPRRSAPGRRQQSDQTCGPSLRLRSAARAIAVAAAALIAVVSASIAPGHPQPTAAAFTGVEYGTGGFAAATLPVPHFTACSYSTAGVTVTWQFDSNPSHVPSSTVAFTISSTLLGPVSQILLPNQVTTTQLSTDHFTTSISSSIVSQILGAVLSSFAVTAQTVDAGWTSPVSRTAKATSLLTIYNCTLS